MAVGAALTVGFVERVTFDGDDVALGLDLHERGSWNVMTPCARLIHYESEKRGTVIPQPDLAVSRQTYAPHLDGREPFYNTNLILHDTTCAPRRASMQPPLS